MLISVPINIKTINCSKCRRSTMPDPNMIQYSPHELKNVDGQLEFKCEWFAIDEPGTYVTLEGTYSSSYDTQQHNYFFCSSCYDSVMTSMTEGLVMQSLKER